MAPVSYYAAKRGPEGWEIPQGTYMPLVVIDAMPAKAVPDPSNASATEKMNVAPKMTVQIGDRKSLSLMFSLYGVSPSRANEDIISGLLVFACWNILFH